MCSFDASGEMPPIGVAAQSILVVAAINFANEVSETLNDYGLPHSSGSRR